MFARIRGFAITVGLLAGGLLIGLPNAAQAQRPVPVRNAVYTSRDAGRVSVQPVASWSRGRYYSNYYGPYRGGPYRYGYRYGYRAGYPWPYYSYYPRYYGYYNPGYYTYYNRPYYVAPPVFLPPPAYIAPPAATVVVPGGFYW